MRYAVVDHDRIDIFHRIEIMWPWHKIKDKLVYLAEQKEKNMKTVIIYGTEHKGSNYNVIQLFKEKLNINEN